MIFVSKGACIEGRVKNVTKKLWSHEINTIVVDRMKLHF